MSVEVTVPECLRVLLSSFLRVPWDLVVADPVLVRVLADSAYRRYLTRGTSQSVRSVTVLREALYLPDFRGPSIFRVRHFPLATVNRPRPRGGL